MKEKIKTHIQSIRFYKEQKDKILELSEAMNITENDVVRKSVDEMYKRYLKNK